MTSRLAEMQARFQQKQIQEREEKLLRLYENQQQRTFERVNRGSAGSNDSLSSSTGGGKVRQMFDERRQKAGIDRSYPLEPLKTTKPVANGQPRGASIDRLKNLPVNRTVVAKTTTTSRTVQQQIKNGKPVANKKEVIHSVYNNNNGVETFDHQHHLFEDDDDRINANNFGRTKNHRDIVDLMNSHNIGENTSLDDEKMPDMGFDEVDNYGGGRKSGKLFGETVEKRTPPGGGATPLGKTFRKETKPLVKRTVTRAAVSSPDHKVPTPSVHSQPPKSVSSPISSPIRSISQTMQSDREKPSAKKSAPPVSTQSAKSPSAARPSAKQTPRSAVVRDDLTECRFCNRRFATDRLDVHESICGKTIKKKRKTYDATKHRVDGTELAPYVKKGGKTATAKSQKQSAKKDWRRTHEEFIAAIRAAKQAQAHVAKGGKLTDLPPPPPSSNPDYVQCPHCGRKFNESAAQRHIPKCANYEFNKPKASTNKAKPVGRR